MHCRKDAGVTFVDGYKVYSISKDSKPRVQFMSVIAWSLPSHICPIYLESVRWKRYEQNVSENFMNLLLFQF